MKKNKLCATLHLKWILLLVSRIGAKLHRYNQCRLVAMGRNSFETKLCGKTNLISSKLHSENHNSFRNWATFGFERFVNIFSKSFHYQFLFARHLNYYDYYYYYYYSYYYNSAYYYFRYLSNVNISEPSLINFKIS